MSDCFVCLSGNATKDPELRFTTGGRAVASFGLAVNRRYQVNNEWQDSVAFHNIVVWGEMAERVAASFTKGARMIVSGRIEQRDWEDKEGNKRVSMEVIADDIGASVKWATVEISKIARTQGHQGPPPPDDAQPAKPQAQRAPDPVYGDEEPF